MNIEVQIALYGTDFISFVFLPRRGIAKLYVSSVFNYDTLCKGFANLQSYQQYLHPQQHLVSPAF